MTEVSSSSSSTTATNEKTKVQFGGSDNGNERSMKRTELIQNAESGSTSAKNPIHVEWHGLNYFIPEKKQKWKFGSSDRKDEKLVSDELNLRNIIKNIHGCANPGEILAIMGPSGCGKTTLLNLLGDRVGSSGVQGTITLNGHKPTKSSKRYIAYCTQDDIFFPYLTVRETLTYTARLRLPRTMSRRDKLKQVDNTMQLLNLTKCADTKIGNNVVRGISGGERKRVNIASELLTDPSVILLDEPTTGLDSSLAFELVKILKEFAVKQGKTIIMVIHQPSSHVFEAFDKLMLMANGRMVYFGEREGIIDYLADRGYQCLPTFNPADYILELLNDDIITQKLIDAYVEQVREDPTGRQIIKKYSHRSHDSNSNDDITNAPISGHRWEATFLQQVLILAERSFKQSRNIILSRIDIIQTFALAVICSIIWFQMSFSEANIADRVGCIFFIVAFWSFYPLLGPASAFPLDLIMLTKERQSRSYRLSSYFIAKQLSELPLILFNPTLFIIPVYWVSRLLPDFGRFVAFLAVCLLDVVTSQGFGYLFGAVLLDAHKSITASIVFMLATMLLGGFFVKFLPSSLSWLRHFSFIKYSYSLLMQIQLDIPKAQFECSSPKALGIGQSSICDSLEGMNNIPGKTILENEKLNDLPWYINLIILIGFLIFSRVLAYYALRRNTRIPK